VPSPADQRRQAAGHRNNTHPKYKYNNTIIFSQPCYLKLDRARSRLITFSSVQGERIVYIRTSYNIYTITIIFIQLSHNIRSHRSQ